MIDEEATFEKFGYYPSDLKPKSNKKVVAVCDDCGKMRIISKNDYHALCHSCSLKGEQNPNFGKRGKNTPNWKGGKAKRICEECGIEFPVSPSAIKQGKGRFCSRKCYGKWRSKHRSGENSSQWKNGASYEPYCTKFNNEFKEYIREKFSRICFLCDKTEEENGRKLDVHHVNGNKNCGCDDDETCQYVPLCRSCHGRAHSKKKPLEPEIRTKMKETLNGYYV